MSFNYLHKFKYCQCNSFTFLLLFYSLSTHSENRKYIELTNILFQLYFYTFLRCTSLPRGLVLDYTVDSIVADDIFTGKFVVGNTSVLKSVSPDNVLKT